MALPPPIVYQAAELLALPREESKDRAVYYVPVFSFRQ
jgi:hypothetical protein